MMMKMIDLFGVSELGSWFNRFPRKRSSENKTDDK